MKIVALAMALSAMPCMAASAVPDRFGEACEGSETVQTGTEAPRQLPYTITLGIDLAQHTYCYAACSAAQTYPIKTVAGSLLTLADLDKGGQVRHIVFDRASGKLTDRQRIAMGPISTTREAEAHCTPTLFPAAG